MGVNNRQRRAAKQRKRAKARAGGAPRHDGASGGAFGEKWSAYDSRLLAVELVRQAIGEVAADSGAAREYAEVFRRTPRDVPAIIFADVLAEAMADVVARVVKAGWAPSDLAEIVTRRATTRLLLPLAAALEAEVNGYRADLVAAAWRDDLSRLGPPLAVDLTTVAGVEQALGLTALLSVLPPIAPTIPSPGSTSATTHRPTAAHSRHLARVRALLAKAESTEYAEEAEALSAKAQELISRHALDRLMQHVKDEADDEIVVRRLWIDAPYVLAKATLISEVAEANRCRAVLSEQLGCSTIIGNPDDLDAVEVMTTSLLAQADAAMLRHGRQTDWRGASRVRSFRRSFLVSYALRIGERLRAATQEATEEAGRADVLLPVLVRQEQRVHEACEELFPELVTRGTSVSNGLGWAAGRAAADLAHLDTRSHLTSEAG